MNEEGYEEDVLKVGDKIRLTGHSWDTEAGGYQRHQVVEIIRLDPDGDGVFGGINDYVSRIDGPANGGNGVGLGYGWEYA